MGLRRVAELARALEHSAEPGELVHALQRALERTCEAITLYAARSTTGSAASHAPANDNERRIHAQKLLAALDSDDPSEIEPLLGTLPSLLPDPEAKQISMR